MSITEAPVTDPGPAPTSDNGVGRTIERFSAPVAIAAPAVLLVILGWQRRWTSDDGFIFFRVVDQIVDGNGPVFNAGERVEAATSTLWVAILSVARLLLPESVQLEHIALVLSLAATFFGLVAAGCGARLLSRAADRGRPAGIPAGIVVPFGALVPVAVAPFWDYSTSGLEMGLVFAWLGGSLWALAAFGGAADARRVWFLAVLFGLGPLIRPDLAIYSVFLVVALLAVERGASWRHRIGVVGAALGLPLAYQVFRMGYYGALVPNPAIAKNASEAQWDRGLDYLGNFVTSYDLWVALPLLAIALAVLATRLTTIGNRRMTVVALVLPAAAVVHALYIVRVGGDFMHARLLLPPAFAIAAPVAVIAVRRWRMALVGAALAVWALVAGVYLTPVPSEFSGDQRGFYVNETGEANPVTLDDWSEMPWLKLARKAERDMQRRPRLLDAPVVGTFFEADNGARLIDVRRRLRLADRFDAKGGFAFTGIGAVSYALGTDVLVIDRLGLGDPLASRVVIPGVSLPIGHERYLSIPWLEARYASPSKPDPEPVRAYAADVGRAALKCGDLAELVDSVEAPMTPGRFWRNLVGSFERTRLEIANNPVEAAEDFCER